MNFIEIMGHLAADPETRQTPSGQKVTTLRVGTRARKGGQDTTIWFRVTIWGDRFDRLMPYFKKGSAVIIRGIMNPPETYVDKNGQTQVSLEIVAEVISFSPFGKPNESGQSASASPSALTQENLGQMNYFPGNGSPYSDQMGPASGKGEEYTRDNCPF